MKIPHPHAAAMQPSKTPIPDTGLDRRMPSRVFPSYVLCCFSFFHSGSRLLSRAVSGEVPSAVRALTVVFGMGTGVAPGRIATGNLSAPRTDKQ